MTTQSLRPIPFDRIALPSSHDAKIPPIVTPKPDIQFGYRATSFNPGEFAKIAYPRLQLFSSPSGVSYWPWLFVELKPPSRGGTIWVAENQNAASGSHSVNSLGKLFECAREPSQMTDSFAFSCVADASHRALWVHWKTAESKLVSAEIDGHSFKRRRDICKMRAAIRSIIE